MKNEDLQYMLEANFRATRAQLSANEEIIKMMHDQVKKQNSRVGTLEKKVEKNTHWRISLTAAGTAIAGFVGFLFTKLSEILDALR